MYSPLLIVPLELKATSEQPQFVALVVPTQAHPLVTDHAEGALVPVICTGAEVTKVASGMAVFCAKLNALGVLPSVSACTWVAVKAVW